MDHLDELEKDDQLQLEYEALIDKIVRFGSFSRPSREEEVGYGFSYEASPEEFYEDEIKTPHVDPPIAPKARPEESPEKPLNKTSKSSGETEDFEMMDDLMEKIIARVDEAEKNGTLEPLPY